jgi:zinc protease
MIARVLEELEQLRQNGPTLDLTTRAKEAARRAHETAMRQNGYWTRNLQAAHFLGYDPGELLERSKRIAAVTPAALDDAFGRYFPFDRYTVVTLVPASAPASSK